MRKTTTIGAAVIALAASGWISSASAQAPADTPPPSTDTSAPAPDTKAPPKKMHHHVMKPGKGKLVATAKGDAEVEDLNAKSLDAAKEGKSFSPPTTPMSEPAAHAGDKSAEKPMKHKMMKHKAMKAKAEAPAADTSAPAPAAPAPEPTPAAPK